jgi:DNA-directed RNA polymerase specialized sigma24 family protein
MRARKYNLSASDLTFVKHLRKKHRDILLAEGTYKEIADDLGLPLGTVRSRLNRARSSLAKLRQEPAA